MGINQGGGISSLNLSEINQSLAETLLLPPPAPTNSLVTMKRAKGDVVVCQAPHAGTFLEKG